jgi:hypothetical protein
MSDLHATPSTAAQAVARVCRLPAETAALNRSAMDVVARSGYQRFAGEIGVKEIETYLDGHPELVPIWLQWSEDKRTSSGWYLVRIDPQTYEVGHLERSETIPMLRADATGACATFILAEVRSIAGRPSILALPGRVVRSLTARLRPR